MWTKIKERILAILSIPVFFIGAILWAKSEEDKEKENE